MDKVLVMVCLLVSLPAMADPADATLEEIVTIARGGAPGLALRLLDRFQDADGCLHLVGGRA